ncbi:uncharacterized protein DNG_04073 [Cephalotrichum gorgonifer]|uniref:Uncharacterized protein n=1 Tax=Cephalotrichum gorgonifer TaxID=2041049 RepID=A0AAE8MVC5_9PEZI|nr:uncharacterized protein DNG_04073 [Cephalotrichum gorgonifer]
MSSALDALSKKLVSERRGLEGNRNQGEDIPEIDGEGLDDVEKVEQIEERIRELDSRMAITKRKDHVVALQCRVGRCEAATEQKKCDWIRLCEEGFPREADRKDFLFGIRQLRAEIEKCKAEVVLLEGERDGTTA